MEEQITEEKNEEKVTRNISTMVLLLTGKVESCETVNKHLRGRSVYYFWHNYIPYEWNYYQAEIKLDPQQMKDVTSSENINIIKCFSENKLEKNASVQILTCRYVSYRADRKTKTELVGVVIPSKYQSLIEIKSIHSIIEFLAYQSVRHPKTFEIWLDASTVSIIQNNISDKDIPQNCTLLQNNTGYKALSEIPEFKDSNVRELFINLIQSATFRVIAKALFCNNSNPFMVQENEYLCPDKKINRKFNGSFCAHHYNTFHFDLLDWIGLLKYSNADLLFRLICADIIPFTSPDHLPKQTKDEIESIKNNSHIKNEEKFKLSDNQNPMNQQLSSVLKRDLIFHSTFKKYKGEIFTEKSTMEIIALTKVGHDFLVALGRKKHKHDDFAAIRPAAEVKKVLSANQLLIDCLCRLKDKGITFNYRNITTARMLNTSGEIKQFARVNFHFPIEYKKYDIHLYGESFRNYVDSKEEQEEERAIQITKTARLLKCICDEAKNSNKQQRRYVLMIVLALEADIKDFKQRLNVYVGNTSTFTKEKENQITESINQYLQANNQDRLEFTGEEKKIISGESTTLPVSLLFTHDLLLTGKEDEDKNNPFYTFYTPNTLSDQSPSPSTTLISHLNTITQAPTAAQS